MDELLKQLLNDLDIVGKSNGEIYDTVCRQRMLDPIFHLFILPDPDYTVRDDFGLTSPAANASVKSAILSYCSAANALADELGIEAFHDRLAAFQNGVASDVEQNYTDDFFGWMNPDNFLASGKLVDNPT
ncbi:hypothetical protein SAMN06265222_1375 [Neorhodopirellula lusitana]|uniref:Uncharacterized protein n=1 Tax=Neorhodopirellula lusitana TaxID=445327 RepID=A0ABY1QV05_9BACT|nr:hypothetical protein [Neorhodopirellula lusitana]SMP79784.1 hypothetical protein SAMN06265222_1375 [Neorhodopirellula lusitana]